MENKSSLTKKLAAIALGLIVSLVVGIIFNTVGIPAPFFIGSILSAAVLSFSKINVKLPGKISQLGQAFVGMMIAERIASGLGMDTLYFLPAFAVVSLLVMGLCGWCGLYLGKTGLIPGSSAIWGFSPGAATAMIFMSSAYGADRQIVSLMQYTRVLFVVLSASIIVGGGAEVALSDFAHQLAQFNVNNFLMGTGIVVLCLVIIKFVKVPAGPLLLPMFLGAFIMKVTGTDIVLPTSVMVIAYVVLGIRIGSTFTREVVQQLWATRTQLVAAILLLIGVSMLAAYLFSLYDHIDFKTAYLAFSPGGLDTAAILSASGNVDIHLVMASQSLRLILVVLCWPWIAKYFSNKIVESLDKKEEKAKQSEQSSKVPEDINNKK